MKPYQKNRNGIALLLILTLLGSSSFLAAQPSDPDSNDSTILSVAKKVIEASGTCTLISLDEAGRPRARVMDPFTPDDDFNLWFGTNPLSRKVAQINRDPRVTVHYFDKESGSYVSIYGRAEIVSSAEQKKVYWKPEWENFYPSYPEGYVLIKLTPEWLEIISEVHGITGDPITWKPGTISFEK